MFSVVSFISRLWCTRAVVEDDHRLSWDCLLSLTRWVSGAIQSAVIVVKAVFCFDMWYAHK